MAKNLSEIYFKENFIKYNNISPICEHFNSCGGCQLQQLSYEDQLKLKLEFFNFLINKFKISYLNINPTIIPSNKEHNYRYKMDFSFDENTTKLGLKQSSSQTILSLKHCFLMKEKSWQVYQIISTLAKDLLKQDLLYCNIKQIENEVMLSLITKDNTSQTIIKNIANDLLAKETITSFHHLLSIKKDSSFGIEYQYYGKQYLTSTLCQQQFLIGPNSFFQTNHHIADKIYSLIAKKCQENTIKNVLDCYSGTASIACVVAPFVEKVIAIESFKNNTPLALQNIKHNQHKNIIFEENDVAVFFKTANLTQIDTIILNPPRNGVDEKVLRLINQANIENIIYVSCNAQTLLEDIKILSMYYDIKDTFLCDMFPQTKHFEMLVFLKRRKTMRL